jgi:hypothetical protein
VAEAHRRPAVSSRLPPLCLDATLGADQTGELASLSWSLSWPRRHPGVARTSPVSTSGRNLTGGQPKP